jgi:predicted secreted protein
MSDMNDKNLETMDAKVDKPFEIELRFPGTSGYEWKPTFDSSRLSLLERRRITNRKSMGGRAKEVFRFCPLLTGDTDINFDLARPWENKSVEHRQIAIHIE